MLKVMISEVFKGREFRKKLPINLKGAQDYPETT
jgi:hypothetical protein